MPLRFIKVPRVNSKDALQMAISATSLARELSSMAFFPPATAAVSVLLLILETIQGLQNNREACFRLAQRCARILLDINDQMRGRWDTAPPTLLKNLERFQGTLISINELMKIQVSAKWGRRFTQKALIEDALSEYSAQLDDASQSFQIATLIDIHYTVSSRSWSRKNNGKEGTLIPPPYEPTIADEISGPRAVDETSTKALESPVEMNDHILPSRNGLNLIEAEQQQQQGDQDVDDYIISDGVVEYHGVLEDHGFRRYHQSEVRLKGKSRFKDGWWAGASAAEVGGQKSLIKRYEGPQNQATRHWLRDVRILQNVYHPSLPQLVGYSVDEAPTPFILLSNVQTRSPQVLLLGTLRENGLAACVDLILHFYQDVTDATLYLQRQMCLDNGKAQDFLDGASYKVDGSNTVIMGLPPPKDGWLTARSYGLTESLKMVVMGMLPNRGTVQYKRIDDVEDDISGKMSHLVTIARGLLPAEDDPISLSLRVKALIQDDERKNDEYSEGRKPNLRQLRLSNIEANTHDHTWGENSGIPPHKFTVGDFGYIPKGHDFDDFVILGNVFKDELAAFPVEDHASGNQWCWKDMPMRRVDIEPYSLPDGVKCWPMAVPPAAQIDCLITHSAGITHVADAWRFMLEKGRFLADEFGINPEELMLITRAGTNQDFFIHDFCTPSPPSGPVRQTSVQGQFGRQPFGQQRPGFGQNPHAQFHRPMFPFETSLPTIMYLLTSLDPDCPPHWSHNPINVRKGASPPKLKYGWVQRIGWCHGFINWIQLHPEDFVE